MSERALRLPGRVFELLLPKADAHAQDDSLPEDLDLADAISNARVKRKGGGFQVFIRITPQQVLWLADWITDDDPKLLRDYRDAMRSQARVVLDP